MDENLFEALRSARADLARIKSVPAYIVFSDKTLKDMALKRPRTLDEFSAVFGVGETKLKAYGDTFIHIIAAYLSQSGS